MHSTGSCTSSPPNMTSRQQEFGHTKSTHTACVLGSSVHCTVTLARHSARRRGRNTARRDGPMLPHTGATKCHITPRRNRTHPVHTHCQLALVIRASHHGTVWQRSSSAGQKRGSVWQTRVAADSHYQTAHHTTTHSDAPSPHAQSAYSGRPCITTRHCLAAQLIGRAEARLGVADPCRRTPSPLKRQITQQRNRKHRVHTPNWHALAICASHRDTV